MFISVETAENPTHVSRGLFLSADFGGPRETLDANFEKPDFLVDVETQQRPSSSSCTSSSATSSSSSSPSSSLSSGENARIEALGMKVSA